MYDVFVVANCVIGIYQEKKQKGISILELMKYMFFCYGWYWAVYQKKMFDGTFVVFPLGPVLTEVYRGFDESYRDGFTIMKKYPVDCDDNVPIDFITEVINKYMDNSVMELSDIIHFYDAPWTVTLEKKGLYAKISDKLIFRHYKGLFEEKSLC